jgi:hypothetical protein
MSPAIPLLIQEGWRAERRGGYLRMEQLDYSLCSPRRSGSVQPW